MQEQLGDATASSAGHTSRTLQSLRRDDLIQLTPGLLKGP